VQLPVLGALPSGRPGEVYYLTATKCGNLPSGMPGEANDLITKSGNSPSGRPEEALYLIAI